MGERDGQGRDCVMVKGRDLAVIRLGAGHLEGQETVVLTQGCPPTTKGSREVL